jgi:hypothetical protein
MTLTANTIPGKFFAAGTLYGYVVERHDEWTYFCDQYRATEPTRIPRLLGINLLRTARYYDSLDDARRAGWSAEVWDRGETVEL